MVEGILYKEEAYRIIGAAMEVHKELKNGFLETVYQEALAKEFKIQDIPFEKESLINIYYKGEKLGKYYKADFICYGEIIIELKALSDLTKDHESQLINYLKATNKKLGILINFGKTSLQYKRIINTLH
ncbi:GxxExxY protein [Saccharicrinis fermentans]|uniref:GxxExxY protein n=1 Tax=Saccharicrinis fermentans DSM 9555 = JCM 21142 TaxID=869213 RepID=W7Y9C8_9BACT|nr:GxxExxY protein [Saccharicrinis fermentans]GAF04947.1 gxxExxY protein [Saccharicrinis fermentans DSM 9555 = JCM 21142]